MGHPSVSAPKMRAPTPLEATSSEGSLRVPMTASLTPPTAGFLQTPQWVLCVRLHVSMRGTGRGGQNPKFMG